MWIMLLASRRRRRTETIVFPLVDVIGTSLPLCVSDQSCLSKKSASARLYLYVLIFLRVDTATTAFADRVLELVKMSAKNMVWIHFHL